MKIIIIALIALSTTATAGTYEQEIFRPVNAPQPYPYPTPFEPVRK
jgi:hypothetical protein